MNKSNQKLKDVLAYVYHQSILLFGEKMNEAILYGSYASGDYHEESDVDIALLLNINRQKLNEYNMPLAHVMTEIFMEFDVLVNIVCIPVDEFYKYRNTLLFTVI